MNLKFLFITLLMTLFICNEGLAQSKSAKEKAKARKEALAKAKAKREAKKKGEDVVNLEDKDEEKDEENVSLMKKLNFEIKPGNLQFNQGFSLSVKPQVGYKFNNYLSSGMGSRLFYNSYNSQQYFDYGGFIYGRAKYKSVYLQAEYASTKFELSNDNSIVINYPLAGFGYMSGRNDDGGWSYGAELMIPLSAEARSYSGLPFEYWATFSYNF